MDWTQEMKLNQEAGLIFGHWGTPKFATHLFQDTVSTSSVTFLLSSFHFLFVLCNCYIWSPMCQVHLSMYGLFCILMPVILSVCLRKLINKAKYCTPRHVQNFWRNKLWNFSPDLLIISVGCIYQDLCLLYNSRIKKVKVPLCLSLLALFSAIQTDSI